MTSLRPLGDWDRVRRRELSARTSSRQQEQRTHPPRPDIVDGVMPERAPDRLTILIVDDNCLYRETLAEIISRRPEVSDLWTAKDKSSVRIALCEHVPDVVLLNLASHGSTDLLALIRSVAPASRLIVIGASEDAEDEIVRCAEAGVAGYLLRSESLVQLIALIGSVAIDETLCSPRVAAVLLRRISALADEPPPPEAEEPLTPREREIRDLLEFGLSNREIAERLFIEVRTVKNHVHHILTKLGVSRRYQAGRGTTRGYQAGTRQVPAKIHAGPR
jgi:DNA-binding NarL/FixJ family response regulator